MNNATSHRMRVRVLTQRVVAITFFATVLASCGGHHGSSPPPQAPAPTTYAIGGLVTGLAGSGLVLRNNGGDDLVVGVGGAFNFATRVASGTAYAVTVKSQPSAPTQVCSVTNGSGSVGAAGVTNVAIDCTTRSFAVGGTVTGLTGSGLMLQDNGGDDLSITADGSFTFATAISSGQAYAVTVVAQPIGQSSTCIVLSGNGTVGSADVTRVSVACGRYRLALVAGQLGGAGNLDGPGAAARFDTLGGAAVDAANNVYVADSNNETIRKISSAGDVTTFAGRAYVSGSVNGSGAAATFSMPSDVAVDANGNLYVADWGNYTIRKITPAGGVSTFAGATGLGGGVDGIGSAARFDGPCSVASDSAGNLYVADDTDDTIRVITPSAVVTTLAGAHGVEGSNDGTGSAARFNQPCAVTVNGAGDVFVADTWNYTIRKITPSGVVTTLAGTAGQSGAVDGTGPAARFGAAFGVAVDGAGNLYVSDAENATIRMVTSAGVVTTLAGEAGQRGFLDGTGAAARFVFPTGLRIAPNGDLLVADTETVRRITPAGVVTTVAGTGASPGSTDGTGATAAFTTPQGVASDAAGNLFVADTDNMVIRAITPGGVVTTLAGTAGVSGSTDGTGPAAQFGEPTAIAIDSSGNLFVGDGCAIRKVTAAGVVTTVAGIVGQCATIDGTGAIARLDLIGGVAVDAAGNIYATETYAQTIRKITPAGGVTTLAGTHPLPGSTDGMGAAARFYFPTGVAVDAAGDLIVTESGNKLVRKVTAAGLVSTLAGAAEQAGTADGMSNDARFGSLSGVAIDGAGNIYVHDTGAIRRIDSAGNVVTLVGVPGVRGVALGALPAGLNHSGGLALLPGPGTRLAVTDVAENAVLEAEVP